MSEELEQLSRRLVGCKGWRWMPGMRTLGEQRWLYKERVTYERYRNIDHSPEIWVQYEALIGTGTFAEVFTLQEALSLCLFPQVSGKSITIEGDEE